MSTTYKVVSMREAIEGKYPDSDWDEYEDLDDYWGDPDWEAVIYRFENDIPVQRIAVDGGEPEDNSFRRDGAWIAPALNTAYARGFADGQRDEALHTLGG